MNSLNSWIFDGPQLGHANPKKQNLPFKFVRPSTDEVRNAIWGSTIANLGTINRKENWPLGPVEEDSAGAVHTQ
jgi:hypothetical protein